MAFVEINQIDDFPKVNDRKRAEILLDPRICYIKSLRRRKRKLDSLFIERRNI